MEASTEDGKDQTRRRAPFCRSGAWRWSSGWTACLILGGSQGLGSNKQSA